MKKLSHPLHDWATNHRCIGTAPEVGNGGISVTEELGQLRKDDAIPKRFRALLKKSVSSLSEAWTKCNEYVLGIRTEPEGAVDCKPKSLQKWGHRGFKEREI